MELSFLAIKVETEAEGATWDQINSLQELCLQKRTPLLLKAGGVEARTDFAMASNIGIEGVIAPMVESEFGVRKFADATNEHDFTWRALTLESRTALSKNLSEILEAAVARKINGVTFGRGDLADSLGLKGREDSPDVISTVEKGAERAKELGLTVTVGGKMELASLTSMSGLFGVIDRLETRRVVIPVVEDLEVMAELLSSAIQFERNLELERVNSLEKELLKVSRRIGELDRRLGVNEK